jgi:Chromosome segregation protein Csm1/Pcs1
MEEKYVNDPHGQVVYTPMLDASRDAKIMSVLPDYLSDEIMFARDQGSPQITPMPFRSDGVASMFYWRINQYLQKKID